MIWVLMTFLGASLLLYCLLGGADFGAGVLEIFVPARNRKAHEKLTTQAMGPVWEANHMWLIILIVILFVGFPTAYTELSIYFHIPLTLMLVGIILRGCAFTFRHYDAVEDGSHRVYSFIFSLASVITPVMFGMIIGGMMLGRLDPDPLHYADRFVWPWLNGFSMAVGCFVLLIFTFLASVYLIGETKDPALKEYFIRRAKFFNALMVLAGGIVLLLAHLYDLRLLEFILTHPFTSAAFVLATISLVFLWRQLNYVKVWRPRVIAGFQVMVVLAGWVFYMFPRILVYADGQSLTLFEAAAPEATVNMLAWALMIGVLVFAPLLAFLFYIFKSDH